MATGDAVCVAQAILALPDEAALQMLSLAPGLSPVAADTPVAEARRNYMRLASLVHPDKIKGEFDKATEAFQKLVRAFELVADPKYRKRLLSQQAKGAQANAKREGKQLTAQQKQRKQPIKRKAKADAKAAAGRGSSKRPPRQKRKTDRAEKEFMDDESDKDMEGAESAATTDNTDSDEDDSGSDVALGDAEPTVSTSRVLLGDRRTGGIYCNTIIRCPQCRTPWEPDTKQHYTLFMGPAGKRVHCETCLCHFGCVTALHACPHCQQSFDYDSSMYDTKMQCAGCCKTFGFPYYPVNQHLIDLVRLEQWREQACREKARERDERAARRQGGNTNTSDAFHRLLGLCIVDEKCPICHRTVTARHQQHFEACFKAAPAMATEKPVCKQRGAKEEAVPAPPKRTARKSAPKPAARRCRKGSTESDSDEDECESDDDDDDDEDETESSADSSSDGD